MTKKKKTPHQWKQDVRWTSITYKSSRPVAFKSTKIYLVRRDDLNWQSWVLLRVHFYTLFEPHQCQISRKAKQMYILKCNADSFPYDLFFLQWFSLIETQTFTYLWSHWVYCEAAALSLRMTLMFRSKIIYFEWSFSEVGVCVTATGYVLIKKKFLLLLLHGQIFWEF